MRMVMARHRPGIQPLVLALAILLLAAASPWPGAAQEAPPRGLGGHDASQPIEIIADRLTVEQASGRAVFSGNVLAEQGEMLLRADHLVVFYDLGDDGASEQAIRRIEVEGNVTIASAEETAVGETGFYDVIGARIELQGNVVLTRDANVIRGDLLEIDLERQLATMSVSPGRPAGERVRALFRPAAARRRAEMAIDLAQDERHQGARAERPSARSERVARATGSRPGIGARRSCRCPGGPARGDRAQEGLCRPDGAAAMSTSSSRPASGRAPGPNGAGKTTSFYMVTASSHRWRADRPRWPRRHRPSDASPCPARHRLSAAGGLDLQRAQRRPQHPGRARGAVRRQGERQRRLSALLDEFGLGHLADAQANTLSGGERRRCEIARALPRTRATSCSTSPWPASTPLNVAEIRHLVGHLKTRGIGVLITDHNVRDTLAIIDRAYILADGNRHQGGQPPPRSSPTRTFAGLSVATASTAEPWAKRAIRSSAMGSRCHDRRGNGAIGIGGPLPAPPRR
jgi:lipopolysaccharide export system ATP-binding protein